MEAGRSGRAGRGVLGCYIVKAWKFGCAPMEAMYYNSLNKQQHFGAVFGNESPPRCYGALLAVLGGIVLHKLSLAALSLLSIFTIALAGEKKVWVVPKATNPNPHRNKHNTLRKLDIS